MAWKTVRLELARTPQFPNGSVSRAYLLRLPLNEDGLVDMAAFRANPAYATVRRHWPNEADRSGYLIHKQSGWAFSYEPGEEDDEGVFHLENHPFHLGDYLTVREGNGDALPFRIVRCSS